MIAVQITDEKQMGRNLSFGVLVWFSIQSTDRYGEFKDTIKNIYANKQKG